MKHILKIAGSLLIDQLVGVISGSMMVLGVAFFFHNSLTGYLLAGALTIFLFAYTAYRSGFKGGFHDPYRVPKDPFYRGYLYKGALAGALSALPLLIIYIIYRITRGGTWSFLFMLSNMYWTWPLMGAFPNHQQLVMASAFAPIVLIPWLSYIAGYKGIIFSDIFLNLYKKIAARLPKE